MTYTLEQLSTDIRQALAKSIKVNARPRRLTAVAVVAHKLLPTNEP